MNRAFADQEKNINFVMDHSKLSSKDKKSKIKIK